MKQLAIKPVIHAFDTCKEFCEAFEIGEGDLIITNEYIFNPLFTDLGIKADVMYQEKYGWASRPTKWRKRCMRT